MVVLRAMFIAVGTVKQFIRGKAQSLPTSAHYVELTRMNVLTALLPGAETILTNAGEAYSEFSQQYVALLTAETVGASESLECTMTPPVFTFPT